MTEDNKDNPYGDIIHLQHPISNDHAPMSVSDRAAQFSPFAALTGYEGAIKETSRLTDQRIELDETEKTILDEKIRMVKEHLGRQQEIEIVFFRPDEKKSGGSYDSVMGVVKKLDGYERTLVMQDGTRISIEEIIDITGEMFRAIDDFVE